MTKGHIYCQAFRYYLYHNSQNILPFCIDDTSSDFIPRILLERTHYNFPFSKLPQKFTSGSKVSFPNFDHKDVEQLLANPDFASLRSLVATLIKQQEICRPPVCQPSKKWMHFLYFLSYVNFTTYVRMNAAIVKCIVSYIRNYVHMLFVHEHLLFILCTYVYVYVYCMHPYNTYLQMCIRTYGTAQT